MHLRPAARAFQLATRSSATRAQIAAGLVGVAVAACGGLVPASKAAYPESGLVLLSMKDGADVVRLRLARTQSR